MKECRCVKCPCTLPVQNPEYMNVCDKCQEECYDYQGGSIR